MSKDNEKINFAIFTHRLDIRTREKTRVMLEEMSSAGKTPMSVLARDILEKAVARRYAKVFKTAQKAQSNKSEASAKESDNQSK